MDRRPEDTSSTTLIPECNLLLVWLISFDFDDKSVLKGSSNQVSLSSWLTEVGKTG